MLNTMDPVSSPVISRYANTFQGCWEESVRICGHVWFRSFSCFF
jgi:hypothetical protein